MNNPFFNKMYGVKSKNEGPFLAFSEEWFLKYQSILLFLLNFPVLKLWFRWILRIHNDCKYSDFIIEIEPGNYKILLKTGEIKADFRTHPKFSKRIYFAFRYWWWCLHYLDELLNITIPQIQFGFETLSSYSSPGANSPCDGYIYKGWVSNQNLSTIRSGDGSSYDVSTTSINIQLNCGTVSGGYSFLYRTFICFDTSSIGAGSLISSALLYIRGQIKYNFIGSPSFCITGQYQSASNILSNSDYSKVYDITFSSISYNDFSITSYNNLTLNSDGLNFINKTSITKLACRFSWDVDNSFTGTWGNGGYSTINSVPADASGTSSDPYISIVYSTSSIKTINGITLTSVSKYTGVLKASIKKAIGIA
jgi:hypothetical protein